MIRAIVFDWSGTLYNDHAAVIKRVERFFPHAPFIRFIFYHPLLRSLRGLLTWVNIGLPHGFTGDDTYYSESNLFPSVKQTLRFLKTKRMRTVILSSQAPSVIQNVIDRADLMTSVDEIHGSVLHKGTFLRRWLRQNHLRAEQVMFVSDLADDINDVRSTGVVVVAAAWGYDTKRRLQTARPYAILHRLDDLRRFLAHDPVPNNGGTSLERSG